MKLYMFRTVPLSIIRSYSLYTQQWYISHRFVDSFRAGAGAAAGSGWNCSSILIFHPDPAAAARKLSVWRTIAECTVNNSWWWTEELSETCRVSFQNKFEKLVRLVGYYKEICHDARSHERKIWRTLSDKNEWMARRRHENVTKI
jgi:hypothetical protein